LRCIMGASFSEQQMWRLS